MVENFHLNLAAVGVSGKRQLDAHLGGAIEGVGIVRKENIGHVASHQSFEIWKHLQSTAAGSALALIVHTDKIEGRPLEFDLRILMPQQSHPVLREKNLRLFFRTGVNFVVAVAAPKIG